MVESLPYRCLSGMQGGGGFFHAVIKLEGKLRQLSLQEFDGICFVTIFLAEEIKDEQSR